MKKILSLMAIGILVLSGFGIGVGIGKETKPELQHSSHNVLILNNDGFEIEAKYSYIRSYRGGGGIFIINMTPENDFSGLVFLWIKGDSDLNIQLNRRILDKESRIAEITVAPNELTEIKTHQIVLTAFHFKMPIITTILNLISKIIHTRFQHLIGRLYDHHDVGFLATSLFDIRRLVLEVEMFNWSSDNLPDAIIKRDELIDWLELEYPEFGNFSDKESFAYMTYPEILIVEHWTFLCKCWEMRICYHVMIPPHDWSKICLRRRGEVNPIFAAMRESDGTIYEINVSEYPIMFGY
ncbi:MAG: hypothetical protein JSW06_04485 [Thermoplasmatales archaeon]|nr:MAG: hypothetical protein JSW06_04485 [Thermoplasmatales archaeon]